jgi:hypothetical protein
MSMTSATEVHDELDVMRTCAEAIDKLSEEAQPRIVRWLADRYAPDLRSPQILPSAPNTPTVNPSTETAQSGVTAKRFVQDKAPRTDIERITVLAYYLTYHRGMRHFKTSDLSALNTEAAQPKFSNAANVASNALKSSGFLADAAKGLRQITSKGEEAVEAMPDREALKLIISKYGSARRRRPVKTARNKAGE